MDLTDKPPIPPIHERLYEFGIVLVSYMFGFGYFLHQIPICVVAVVIGGCLTVWDSDIAWRRWNAS